MAESSTENLLEGFADFAQLGKHLEEAGRLWGDAFYFVTRASAKRIREERKMSFLRAAVIMAAAAFEGWTNFLAAKILADARPLGLRLTEFEADCLHEKKRQLQNAEVNVQNGRFTSQERFLLLYRILNDGEKLDSAARADLQGSFRIRDRLIHPKPSESVGASDLASAFSGFFNADKLLARAWVEAKSNRTRRPVLLHT